MKTQVKKVLPLMLINYIVLACSLGQSFDHTITSTVIPIQISTDTPFNLASTIPIKSTEILNSPVIGGILNLDDVGGLNWSASSMITIRVFSAHRVTLLSTRITTANEEGHFYQSVGVDLVPGMEVEVTDGIFTKEVTLFPLTVDVLDKASGTASGTALAGSQVYFLYDTWQLVTVNDMGFWTVYFTVSEDLKIGGIQVESRDGDGDATVVKVGF